VAAPEQAQVAGASHAAQRFSMHWLTPEQWLALLPVQDFGTVPQHSQVSSGRRMSLSR
jgi:hypothetical protein